MLVEKLDELFSRAKYLEEKQLNTFVSPDFWIRLTSVCERARLVYPEILKNVAPDESNKT
jgi:hypothetical protein